MLSSRVQFFGLLASAAFFLSSGLLFSQDQNFSFSAYSNFAFSNKQVESWHPLGVEVKRSNYALGYCSPAVLLYNDNGDFHEFEIARFRFKTIEAEVYGLDSLHGYSHLVGGANFSEINIALRYTYSFLIDLTAEQSKFKFYIGAGASPYYQREWLTPKTSDLFPVSSSAGGVRLSAIPTITYAITDHWFLNLNIPITVADVFSSTTKTEDPRLPISDRKSTTVDIDLLPNEILVRFGLGLRI